MFMFLHANYSEVKKLLAPYIDNLERFDMVANKMSYPQNVKSGRFYSKQWIAMYLWKDANEYPR
jgi:UPF0755 protein